MAKRTIKVEAANDDVKVKLSVQIETDGLTADEIDRKVENLRNDFIDVLRHTYHYSQIKA
jgi:hypothetical protein